LGGGSDLRDNHLLQAGLDSLKKGKGVDPPWARMTEIGGGGPFGNKERTLEKEVEKKIDTEFLHREGFITKIAERGRCHTQTELPHCLIRESQKGPYSFESSGKSGEEEGRRGFIGRGRMALGGDTRTADRDIDRRGRKKGRPE